jgi:CrcB protein
VNHLAGGFVAVGLGAMLGAWLRWGFGVWLNPRFPGVPLGTLAANLLGGYLVGVAVAWISARPEIPPEWRLFIVTGFLGGLTTFSTFSANRGHVTREYGWAAPHHLAPRGSIVRRRRASHLPRAGLAALARANSVHYPVTAGCGSGGQVPFEGGFVGNAAGGCGLRGNLPARRQANGQGMAAAPRPRKERRRQPGQPRGAAARELVAGRVHGPGAVRLAPAPSGPPPP